MSWNPRGCPCKSHDNLRIQALLIASLDGIESCEADPYELVYHARLLNPIHEFTVELALEI